MLTGVARHLVAAAYGERASAARASALQGRLLSRLLSHAHADVPYYRRVFDQALLERVRSAADLPMLPILDRATLANLPAEDILADGFGAESTKSAATSGSSGVPVTIYNSGSDLSYLRAVCLNDLFQVGLRPWDRLAYFRVRPFARQPFERLGLVPCAHIDTSAGIDEQVEAFLAFRPTFLVGFPNVIYSIVEELRRRRFDYRGVRRILFGGERLPLATRTTVEDYFQASGAEVYASVEAGTIARSCPRGNLHLRSTDVIVEVEADDGGLSVESGEGEVIITRLRSEAMPLIRYRIGDRARIEPDDCLCRSFHSPIVREVRGRSEDRITTPDGRRLCGDFITFAIDRFPDIRRLQILDLGPGEIEVAIVASASPRPDLHDAVLAAVAAAAPTFSVGVRLVERIEPERNGKIMVVKSQR